MKQKHLKEKEFNQIKSLLSAEITIGQISTLLKRSRNTIRKVSNSKDFSEYDNKFRAGWKAMRARAMVHKVAFNGGKKPDIFQVLEKLETQVGIANQQLADLHSVLAALSAK